ncbi:MAG TPA: DNA topoisomerase VI subunit B, partial [archaeon]|nr:DNA topoisomerase VI subunit B [archaeon]
NEIVEITLESNRKIKVTGCHSLFTINDVGEIEIVEARKLSTNSRIVIPHFLPSPEEKKDTFILDYIESEWFGGKWIYVYNIDGGIFEELSKEFKVIHKITDKSRKYHRLERNGKQIDILDDSWKQYVAKGFLPLHLVYELGIKERMKESVLKTYYHGKETIVPASIEITPSLMRLLGLYTAEGHADKRQIGFTFGKHEDSLIEEITRTAREMGLNTTIEHRDRSIRVKLFGQVLVELIEKWCGKGAHNKHVPDFAFSVSQELRQHYLDALYQGDGHKVPERNQLMFSSVSSRLANEVAYLWLMQGVIASLGNSISTKGLGKNPCISYRVNLYGSSINKSFVFEANRPLKGSHLLRGQNQMLKQIYAESDLALIKVKNIRIIEEGFGSVYDLSIPNCENFVGGLGGIACHNSRGQQGIGVSAAVLYSQLTAGKPTKIWSRISEKKPVHYFEIRIDTTKNEPIILEDKTIKDGLKEHGVIVEMEIEGKFMERYHSVEEYLKQTAAINPFAKITYVGPDRSKVEYPRKVNELPPLAKSIKPHPHGVELGMLERMMKLSDARSVSSFLTKEFSRVGGGTADQLCKMANIKSATKPAELDHEKIEKLWRAIQSFPFMKPPTDCLSPIGEKAFAEGIRKEFEVEFVEAVTRPPSVYRGNPFQIEACIGYGGKLPTNEPAKLLRFANRVPLLYQASSCATVKSLQKIEWRSYGMEKQGNTPYGPVVIAIHMASVWIPYVSEAKEAIANYPEIMKEIKLAVQECGRKLYRYLSGRKRREDAAQRQSLFEKYIPEAAAAIGKLADLQKDKIQKDLEKMLKKGEVLKQEEQSAEPEAKEEKGEDNGGEE